MKRSKLEVKELKEKIKNLYFKGITQREIGKIVGLRPSTVNYHLSTVVPNKETLKNKQDDKILPLLKDGLSTKEICKELNINLNTLYKKEIYKDFKYGIYDEEIKIMKTPEEQKDLDEKFNRFKLQWDATLKNNNK
jgi:DNA-binding CsgD family transcriptional regulator